MIVGIPCFHCQVPNKRTLNFLKEGLEIPHSFWCVYCSKSSGFKYKFTDVENIEIVSVFSPQKEYYSHGLPSIALRKQHIKAPVVVPDVMEADVTELPDTLDVE